ncbi:SGNH hydrolase-type esterase domain-containing protein [Aspergillus crustosus]
MRLSPYLWVAVLSLQTVCGLAIDTGFVARKSIRTDANSTTNNAAKILRILPLGASITWGTHSSNGNGYRKYLKDDFEDAGYTVNFVGSRKNGNMVDNEVEARPGNTIDQVSAAASASLHYKPNIVLINAGTNDARRAIDIPNAGKRMRSLINKLTAAPDMRNTLIVLSTLLSSGNTAISRHTPAINNQYRALVRAMRAEGVQIVLAEINSASSIPRIVYPDDFRQGGALDNTHPGDTGYKKMATIWANAVAGAAAQGLISKPAPI